MPYARQRRRAPAQARVRPLLHPRALVRDVPADAAAHRERRAGRGPALTRTRGKLARNVAWLGAGEVVLKGALFGAGVLVARGLGPAAMGAFTVAYGAAMVLMLVLAGRPGRGADPRDGPPPGGGPRARPHLARVAAAGGARGGARWRSPAPRWCRDPGLRWTLLAFIPYAWLRSGLDHAWARSFKGLDRMDVEVGGRGVELGVALPAPGALAALAGPGVDDGAGVRGRGRGGPRGDAPAATRAAGSRRRARPAGVPRPRGGGRSSCLNLGLQAVMRLDTFMLAGLGVAREEIGRYGVAARAGVGPVGRRPALRGGVVSDGRQGRGRGAAAPAAHRRGRRGGRLGRRAAGRGADGLRRARSSG